VGLVAAEAVAAAVVVAQAGKSEPQVDSLLMEKYRGRAALAVRPLLFQGFSGGKYAQIHR
jgi:hypothetical protein